MSSEFTNPLSFQTVARTKDGSYLFHLAEWRDLGKSIATAKAWCGPKQQRKGNFAQVTDNAGKVLFDSRY